MFKSQKVFSNNNRYQVNIGSGEFFQDQKIAICTHHKCGTTLMKKIFIAVGENLNYKIWSKYYEPDRYTDDDWDIVFEQHSRISNIKQSLKGIHCIRRPESLIFSATLYHQTAKSLGLISH